MGCCTCRYSTKGVSSSILTHHDNITSPSTHICICRHSSGSACKGWLYYVRPPSVATVCCDLNTGDQHMSVMTFPLTRVAVGL